MSDDASAQRDITAMLLQHNAERAHVHRSESIFTPRKATSGHSQHAANSREALKGKSHTELTQLLEQNQKLLQNGSLVSSLPDKGAKIRQTVQTVNDLLEERKGVASLEVAVDNMHLDTPRQAGSSQRRPGVPEAGRVKVLTMEESLKVAHQAREREKEEARARALAKMQSSLQQGGATAPAALSRLQSAYLMDQEPDEASESEEDDDIDFDDAGLEYTMQDSQR
ncbi:hypothetical protein RI367_008250 [Sorochytrium milnesiophthora]